MFSEICAMKDHSTQLVGINNPLFGIFIAILCQPSTFLHFGSLGDIVFLCRTARRHTKCSSSTPILSLPLGINSLKHQLRIRPFGKSRKVFDNPQVLISSIFQLPSILFARLCHVFVSKSKYLKLKALYNFLKQIMCLRTLNLSKFSK